MAAIDRAKEFGAKKAVRLPISIAAHSPLMERAAADFRAAVKETPFHAPIIPIVGNTQARPLTTVEEARSELAAQLTSPVRWTESIQEMIKAGITKFVELGSKDVLTKLLKRIDRSTTGYMIDSPEHFQALKGD
jgi:[acyl-carrier-protein] S-malonyltransferase